MSNLSFLLNKDKISGWAYEYCRDVNDDPEVRKNIIESYWAYRYCGDIKDDPKVRRYIK